MTGFVPIRTRQVDSGIEPGIEPTVTLIASCGLYHSAIGPFN